MTDIEYKNTLYEVDEIFNILHSTLMEKIPEKLKKYIKENKAKDYKFQLDYSKKLEDQELLETTEMYLTFLYIKYWSDNSKREKLLGVMKENENKYREELNKKYNLDSLFKNNKMHQEKLSSEDKILNQENQIIEYKKEKFVDKIINKIKEFFKRKK